MFSQVNIQMQDSMQLKVTMQWNQNIKNRNEKTLTNGSDINTLVSTRRAWEVNWYPFRGKLWLHRLSIKGREERVKGDGSDVIICVFTPRPCWGKLAASPGKQNNKQSQVRRRSINPFMTVGILKPLEMIGKSAYILASSIETALHSDIHQTAMVIIWVCEKIDACMPQCVCCVQASRDVPATRRNRGSS